MNRWKLTLQYDGSRFAGWQRQPDQRTVQGELEQALSRFYNRQIEVSGQGRTDSGVHAEEQIAHCDLPELPDPERMIQAVRSLLPSDMTLTGADVVHSTFHARFDAISRQYRYQITRVPVPLYRHLYWLFPSPLNLELLCRCGELVRGTHDFRNFAKLEESGINTSCTIIQSEWIVEKDYLIYRIEGNRFLRHLVRRLAGSMIQVAAGRQELEEFKAMLDGAVTSRKGHAAPAHGLVLERVQYPE